MSAQPAAAARRATSAAPPVLTVVTPPLRRRGYIPYISLCLLVLVAGLVTVLALNMALAQGSFEIRKLKTELASLQTDSSAIKESLTQKTATGYLADRARELGMIEADATAYIIIESGTIIGSAPAAGGDDAPEE
jgi:cell division protein FtsB